MKNTTQLVREMMDMSEATRGISMRMLQEQFSQKTIDECIKKEYIQLRSWFAGDFDAQDKDEYKYKDRSGGIYIPTDKGKKFLKDVLCKDFLTEERINAKFYSLDLTVKDKKTRKIYVYSKDGKDIVPSFEPHKVANIKREKDKYDLDS